MHIHWLVPAVINDPKEIIGVNLASIRLRAGVVVQALQNSEHTISLGDYIPQSTDICMVGKIGGLDTQNRHVSWIHQLSAFKGSIIIDCTDDHLSFETVMTAFYFECLKLVSCIVCSSNYLKERTSQYYSGPIHVIPDAIEYEIRPPKNIYNTPIRLMWFGHATNIEGLIEFLPKIRSSTSVELNIISNLPGLQIFKASNISGNLTFKVHMHLWSLETTKTESVNNDICIIPSKISENRKAGASSNRLLTSLALGMPTCADIIDSYSPFKTYFGDLRSSEFSEMIAEPEIWNFRIQSAQQNILPDYTIDGLGKKWIALLGKFS